MITMVIDSLRNIVAQQMKYTSSKPLAIFRILFGIVMCISAIRFVSKGWVQSLYLKPTFHFKYVGFDWVVVPSETILYSIFVGLIISTLFVALGFLYRISIILFFLLFTYVQLMDKALYLNHYYLIILVAFLLIFLPANVRYSLDSRLGRVKERLVVPAFMVNVLKLQFGLVYFYAGFAKLSSAWLFEAMPLKIWLQSKVDFPIIGSLFQYEWTAYAFSWSGALFDLTVPFLLLNQKTRKGAFLVLVIFHLFTWFMFNIGMFPFVMIAGSTLFFTYPKQVVSRYRSPFSMPINTKRVVTILIAIYFSIQLFLPLRYFFWNGNTWNEVGYRYSWNVMRVEKAGYIDYTCRDLQTGLSWTHNPAPHLTLLQYKQMAFQPDMIVQYAHHIEQEYGKEIEVYANSRVTMNGAPSQEFIDSSVDLTEIDMGLFSGADYVLPQVK